MTNRQNKTLAEDFFLPDFCQAQSVFLVLLIAELLAVIFTLLNVHSLNSLWRELGFYSIAIQIIALVSVSSLCLLRSWLSQYNDWIAGLLSLLVILIATLIFSLLTIYAYWLQSIDLSQKAQWHFLLRNLLISGLIGAIALRYFYLQLQYHQQLTLESSARLDALQARIRPHFFFNSLNVIASLTRLDPSKAETAIEDLSELFRATLDNRQALIPLQQELDIGERYLAIEKLRLGDRLTIEINLEPAAGLVLVPPLSLQPLLENAVYHGIQMLPQGGLVTVDATLSSDVLTLQVCNPAAAQKNHNGHGMALANIGQRLEVIYQGKASLTQEVVDDRYCVVMRLPLLQNNKLTE